MLPAFSHTTLVETYPYPLDRELNDPIAAYLDYTKSYACLESLAAKPLPSDLNIQLLQEWFELNSMSNQEFSIPGIQPSFKPTIMLASDANMYKVPRENIPFSAIPQDILLKLLHATFPLYFSFLAHSKKSVFIPERTAKPVIGTILKEFYGIPAGHPFVCETTDNYQRLLHGSIPLMEPSNLTNINTFHPSYIYVSPRSPLLIASSSIKPSFSAVSPQELIVICNTCTSSLRFNECIPVPNNLSPEDTLPLLRINLPHRKAISQYNSIIGLPHIKIHPLDAPTSISLNTQLAADTLLKFTSAFDFNYGTSLKELFVHFKPFLFSNEFGGSTLWLYRIERKSLIFLQSSFHLNPKWDCIATNDSGIIKYSLGAALKTTTVQLPAKDAKIDEFTMGTVQDLLQNFSPPNKSTISPSSTTGILLRNCILNLLF